MLTVLTPSFVTFFLSILFLVLAATSFAHDLGISTAKFLRALDLRRPEEEEKGVSEEVSGETRAFTTALFVTLAATIILALAGI